MEGQLQDIARDQLRSWRVPLSGEEVLHTAVAVLDKWSGEGRHNLCPQQDSQHQHFQGEIALQGGPQLQEDMGYRQGRGLPV